ncbi:hypothetical protein KAI56_01240 [Candidatus Parcubacteria bacterium]|nr:hypothetical protein [Candidatus Parcubacteria bacterium]
MLSTLPNSDNVPYVPVEVFQNKIRDAIEEKTGKRFTVKELQQLDMGDIERILGIKAKRPSPLSLYKFRSPKSVAYNRAVINGLLMKEN